MSKFIPNSFQVPNALVDDVLGNLSDAALRVYIIIIRKTRGWHKESDRISLSQFMDFSGVKSRTTVSRAVAELVNIGLVDEVKNSKGNIYRLSDNPMTSLKNGHTKDILLKQENNLLKQGKEPEVFEDQKAILADTMQRESPKPPEPLPTIRGRLIPNHQQASVQALSKVPPAVSSLYQDLRRLCVDLSLDDPCLSLAGTGKASRLTMTVLHLKTNGGFIRGMWYTMAEMGLAEQVAA